MAFSFPACVRPTVPRRPLYIRQATHSAPRPPAQTASRDNHLRTLNYPPPMPHVPPPHQRNALSSQVFRPLHHVLLSLSACRAIRRTDGHCADIGRECVGHSMLGVGMAVMFGKVVGRCVGSAWDVGSAREGGRVLDRARLVEGGLDTLI